MQKSSILNIKPNPISSKVKAICIYNTFGSLKNGRNFSMGSGYRFGFNNQEKDKELGEYYAFEFRIHDARLGRFLSVDPLYKQYPFYSQYAFCGNRVIDSREIEGLEPGKLFLSPDQAANDFGKLFNDNSIRSNKEYGTKIYVVYIFYFPFYSYGKPNIGDDKSVDYTNISVPDKAAVVAYAHTHAASTKNARVPSIDNDFSGIPGLNFKDNGDIGVYENKNLNGYVSTPDGSLIKYDVKTNKKSLVNMSQPKDNGSGNGGPGKSPKNTLIYTLRKGETFETIAANLMTTVDAIKKENKITDSKPLKEGTTLNITN